VRGRGRLPAAPARFYGVKKPNKQGGVVLSMGGVSPEVGSGL
jgi:hypothetical protein